jgi:acetolactate synthase-1/2/3 large subunit
MELETAVRLKLNLVHMVWIDGTYDTVQERAKYKRTSDVDFGSVDIVKIRRRFWEPIANATGHSDVVPITTQT